MLLITVFLSHAIQIDIPQHAQAGQAEASPIAEEDEGVETSVPTPDVEINSPDQIAVESSCRQDKAPESDVEADLDADQFIITPRENLIAGNFPLTCTLDSIGNAKPLQTDPTLDPIALGQLEEANP